MRHQVQGRKLSRRREHRTAMLANLASSLILTGRVKTTDAKAKEVRPFVERLVTFARRGDLHARRIVLSRLRNSVAVKKLFDEIAPKFTDRFGGYTRIIKLGFRHGDNSPVSLIEFVSDEEQKKTVKRKKKAAPKSRKKAAKETVKATEDQTVESEETPEAPEEADEAPVEAAAETEEVAEEQPVEEKAVEPEEEAQAVPGEPEETQAASDNTAETPDATAAPADADEGEQSAEEAAEDTAGEKPQAGEEKS